MKSSAVRRNRSRGAAGVVLMMVGLMMVGLAACSSGSAGSGDASPSEPDTSVAVIVDLPTVPTATSPTATENVDTPPPESPEEPTGESVGPVDDESVDKGIVTRAANATDTVLPEGFESVTARVTSGDGEVCEICLWLADDDVLRSRGLMGVTDLGDAVGMAFRWDQPHTGNFFMFQTPTPLSIAWFSEPGEHVGQAEMEPCLVENSAICERYNPNEPYTVAIEMFDGQLGAAGIGPGSSLELLDLPCA